MTLQQFKAMQVATSLAIERDIEAHTGVSIFHQRLLLFETAMVFLEEQHKGAEQEALSIANERVFWNFWISAWMRVNKAILRNQWAHNQPKAYLRCHCDHHRSRQATRAYEALHDDGIIRSEKKSKKIHSP